MSEAYAMLTEQSRNDPNWSQEKPMSTRTIEQHRAAARHGFRSALSDWAGNGGSVADADLDYQLGIRDWRDEARAIRADTHSLEARLGSVDGWHPRTLTEAREMLRWARGEADDASAAIALAWLEWFTHTVATVLVILSAAARLAASAAALVRAADSDSPPPTISPVVALRAPRAPALRALRAV